ncbi:bifunctional phosphopantothenoylcysteine decarboxylase/phosphopantothenate--cysteine ligase CoaBC [Anaeromyxobacter diazotrophicus]|uniref:Coenzyme A biosynthesis bifunctional protein CoaBC n=1 Tax=Anaeromyxobacter diazotrophicus TaxID=2590199 RepID=A0A7I9VSV2_9BACT|nr:bifunctional phosphopantothenoylcysteine decarboxylase/phosphopantothenate--cysteine ligase CoaBC [Anaeromyxobacter diazotrophicus]GEJ59298.1 peptidase ClpP [Anaeromyxobacter diazotrophicus]
MHDFSGRTVVLGVGGGIAAYKACELARLFVKGGAQVRVAMTPAATRFVGPLTFQALTGAPVLVDLLAPEADRAYGHLALARAADLLVVAPATADLIARLRAGMADDAVTTTALACEAPCLLAPAMNTRMWQNPAVRENVAALARRGWEVVGPAAGALADGDVGEGRLAEPGDIADAAARLLGSRDLSGRRVLVSAGPTREPLDPVRFISNPSTGKMGFAVARVAARRGAEVVLVTGPVDLPDPPGVRTIRVVTAEEMASAVEEEAREIDLYVGAAAVSDFKPRVAAATKKKKSDEDEEVTLTRTPDILAALGKRFAGKAEAPILVGFAAETEALLQNARKKLAAKRCDLVVANKVGRPGVGFASDRNRVTLVGPGERANIEGTKEQVADAILDWVVPVLEERRPRG